MKVCIHGLWFLFHVLAKQRHTHVGCIYSQGKFPAGWRHWLLYRAENKLSSFAVDEVIKSLQCSFSFFCFHVRSNRVFYCVSSQGASRPQIKWLVWASERVLSERKHIPFRSQTDQEPFSVRYCQTVKIDSRTILVGLEEKNNLLNIRYLFLVSERLKSHMWRLCGQGPLSNYIMRMHQQRLYHCHWAQRPHLTCQIWDARNLTSDAPESQSPLAKK